MTEPIALLRNPVSWRRCPASLITLLTLVALPGCSGCTQDEPPEKPPAPDQPAEQPDIPPRSENETRPPEQGGKPIEDRHAGVNGQQVPNDAGDGSASTAADAGGPNPMGSNPPVADSAESAGSGSQDAPAPEAAAFPPGRPPGQPAAGPPAGNAAAALKQATQLRQQAQQAAQAGRPTDAFVATQEALARLEPHGQDSACREMTATLLTDLQALGERTTNQYGNATGRPLPNRVIISQ